MTATAATALMMIMKSMALTAMATDIHMGQRRRNTISLQFAFTGLMVTSKANMYNGILTMVSFK